MYINFWWSLLICVLLFVICSTVHGGKESIWQIQILNNVLVLLDALSGSQYKEIADMWANNELTACGLRFIVIQKLES